eukprot:scaffold2585_cov368-Prasinococcus_capsulatus_cf.AAC.7
MGVCRPSMKKNVLLIQSVVGQVRERASLLMHRKKQSPSSAAALTATQRPRCGWRAPADEEEPRPAPQDGLRVRHLQASGS